MIEISIVINAEKMSSKTNINMMPLLRERKTSLTVISYFSVMTRTIC